MIPVPGDKCLIIWQPSVVLLRTSSLTKNIFVTVHFLSKILTFTEHAHVTLKYNMIVLLTIVIFVIQVLLCCIRFLLLLFARVALGEGERVVALFTSVLPFLPGHQIHPRSAHAQSSYFGVAPDQATAPLEPWQEALGDLKDQVLSYRDTKQK